MKNHGYPKPMMHKIGNLAIIPTMLVTFFVKKITKKRPSNELEFQKRSQLLYILNFLATLTIFMFDVTERLPATICLIVNSILFSLQMFMDFTIINSLSDSLFSGMYVTIMASAANLGRNGTVSLKVIEWLGYNNGCIIGFIYSAVSLVALGWFHQWIMKGEEEKDIEKDKI